MKISKISLLALLAVSFFLITKAKCEVIISEISLRTLGNPGITIRKIITNEKSVCRENANAFRIAQAEIARSFDEIKEWCKKNNLNNYETPILHELTTDFENCKPDEIIDFEKSLLNSVKISKNENFERLIISLAVFEHGINTRISVCETKWIDEIGAESKCCLIL